MCLFCHWVAEAIGWTVIFSITEKKQTGLGEGLRIWNFQNYQENSSAECMILCSHCLDKKIQFLITLNSISHLTSIISWQP